MRRRKFSWLRSYVHFVLLFKFVDDNVMLSIFGKLHFIFLSSVNMFCFVLDCRGRGTMHKAHMQWVFILAAAEVQ